MKIPHVLVMLTPVLFCLAASEAKADRFLFLKRAWGDCVVVTEMTEAGRALTPPSREKPVYFLGESLGCRLGSAAGERLPDPKEIRQFVAKILARQGFLAAEPGVHDPELFLVLQWGRLDPRSGESLWFLGYNPKYDIAAPTLPPGLLGPEVWRRDMRSRETQTVLDYADEDLYGIIISAFEYRTAFAPEPVVLWQTRIGLPANGKGMTDALTTMARVAGPQIGRETTKPVLRNTHDSYSTELGELEVIGIADDEVKGEAGNQSP